MQDKVLDILLNAPKWMTADDVANKGKFRSVANVALLLKNLGDRVTSRKSPTRRNPATDQPLVEWKHADKAFGNDGADIDVPVIRKNRTTEMPADKAPPAIEPDPITRRARVVEVPNGKIIDDLRAQLKLASQQRDDHFNRAESLQQALEDTDRRLGVIGTMLINTKGDSIEDKLGKVLHEHVHGAGKILDLEDDVRRHSSGLQEASTSILRFLIASQQITGGDHKPHNLAEAEQQIAATVRGLQSRIEELEHPVSEPATLAIQATDAIDVTEAAIGYVIRVAGKKLQIRKNPRNAHAVAMSSARTHGRRANVLALVPIGSAVPGAEWKPEQ